MSSGPPIDEIGRALDWIELAFAASGRTRLTESKIVQLVRLGDPELGDDDAEAAVEALEHGQAVPVTGGAPEQPDEEEAGSLDGDWDEEEDE